MDTLLMQTLAHTDTQTFRQTDTHPHSKHLHTQRHIQTYRDTNIYKKARDV